VVANNLTGGSLMMRELFLQSFQAHGGAIVNMTADFRNGMPGMAHSGAARAGMSNLTMTASFEWASCGVRVNAVAPGWIASSGMDTYGGAMKTLIPKLKRHVPLRRLGLEAEVSAAIVFLLSPAAAFITGVTLQIDGGASLGSPLFPSVDHDRSVPFDGFHRAVTPDVLLEKLGGGEAVATANESELDLRALGFSERERKMLLWVDGEATVEDLSLASGLKPDAAFRALLELLAP
jgi:citronellol/citronellal dehydrogenase